MSGPPPRLGQEKRVKLLKLIEQHTRIEVGLRTGSIPPDTRPKGGLSLANDLADTLDEIRKLVFGTSNVFDLADKFGFKPPRREKK